RQSRPKPACPQLRRGLLLRHRLRELIQNGFIGRALRPTAVTGTQMLRNRTDGLSLEGMQKGIYQQLFILVAREGSSHCCILRGLPYHSDFHALLYYLTYGGRFWMYQVSIVWL